MPDLSFENGIETESETAPENLIAPIFKIPDGNDSISIELQQKPKRNKFEWNLHSEYTDINEALDFLTAEGFVRNDEKDLEMGTKYYFRCKHVPKKHKPWCDKRFVLYLPSNSLNFEILHNSLEHNHHEIMKNVRRPPSDEMSEYINELFAMETFKTSTVLKHIEKARVKYLLFANEPNPLPKQIEYCLRKFRASLVKPMIKLGDLMEYCDGMSDFPSNPDTPFVFAHKSSEMEEELGFIFNMSKPRLLSKFNGTNKICIDATYSLNWLGYPLIVMGTVDRRKVFHPLVYACTTHEKTQDYEFVFASVKESLKKHLNIDFEPEILIADGADSIRNAFYKVFGSARLDVMCWAHVIRNVCKRPFSNKNNKPLIVDDIKKIQLSPNQATFRMMSSLFCEKWNPIEPSFVDYFVRELLGVHCNWWEGAAYYTPSTNNGIESHNSVIKRKVTMRKRLPLNTFIIAMKEMTSDISKQFADGSRIISTEPIIQNELLARAAVMVRAEFKCFKAKSSASRNIVFIIPSSTCKEENATEKYYKILVQTQWKSLDQFIKYGYQQFWIVNFSKDKWKTESKCTCPQFLKNYICKHVVALAYREKCFEIPESAYPTLLQATRKKAGRPKNATKALIVQ